VKNMKTNMEHDLTEQVRAAQRRAFRPPVATGDIFLCGAMAGFAIAIIFVISLELITSY